MTPNYKTDKELRDKIQDYFDNGIVIKKSVQVPTISGLCLHLGFESRQSFYDYQKKDKFSYTIKRARLRIEKEYEEQLQVGNTVGAIFALKNLGWSDKQEIDHTSKGEKLAPINITVDSSETAETLKKLRDGAKAN